MLNILVVSSGCLSPKTFGVINLLAGTRVDLRSGIWVCIPSNTGLYK